jgi:hypothetical protein
MKNRIAEIAKDEIMAIIEHVNDGRLINKIKEGAPLVRFAVDGITNRTASLPIEHVETCGECEGDGLVWDIYEFDDKRSKPCPSCKEGKVTWVFEWHQPDIISGGFVKFLSAYDLVDPDVAYTYSIVVDYLNNHGKLRENSFWNVGSDKGTIRAIRKEKG